MARSLHSLHARQLLTYCSGIASIRKYFPSRRQDSQSPKVVAGKMKNQMTDLYRDEANLASIVSAMTQFESNCLRDYHLWCLDLITSIGRLLYLMTLDHPHQCPSQAWFYPV